MIARVAGSGERNSTYEIDDSQVAAGSTLGAPRGLVVIKANGAIEKFYSVDAGETLIQDVQLRFWEEHTGTPLMGSPGRFVIHPDRQEHIYELADGLVVTETIFVLNAAPRRGRICELTAYYAVHIDNGADRSFTISSLCAANLRGTVGADLTARYDPKLHAFLVANASRPEFARAFGASRVPRSWEITSDHGKSSRIAFCGLLSNRIPRGGGHIALFHHRHRLAPRSRTAFSFMLLGISGGLRRLSRTYHLVPSVAEASDATRKRYDEILRRAVVMTPDPIVNRGALWAKANMLRSEIYAPTGWCFVNDPGRSNNSVARDTAWFAYGADYVDAGFSQESLLQYVRHLERRGKVVEYYDVRNGKSADYGLNVNDDTPLILLALWHHFNTTGDARFLRRVYRGAKRAGEYLLSQRDKRGLIWCTATGTADWGIAGWRNVIEGYSISGATTELNSECYAAFGAVAKMAQKLGETADAERFSAAARSLRGAINAHLLDPHTGLYYLNIGLDGVAHTNVTCDLVFPVMFGVADHETATHIVARLSVNDFWTEAGLRTVPRDDLEYGPTHGYGLLGGVWVGVTFWFAFAAARFNPDFMATTLRNSFRHYSRDPRRNNTVPGQFSEWLHGETLVNQGMMLSPWYPPRYLWAAIEGAAGLDLSGDEPAIDPRVPSSWHWLGVRNVRLRGRNVTWLVVREPELKMYSTFGFKSPMQYECFDEDVTDELIDAIGSDMTAIALRRDGEVIVFVGNTADRTVAGAVRLRGAIPNRLTMRCFRSLIGEWSDEQHVRDSDLRRGIPLQIGRGGFALLALRSRDAGA